MKDKGALFAISCLTAFGVIAWFRDGFNAFSVSMLSIALLLFVLKKLGK